MKRPLDLVALAQDLRAAGVTADVRQLLAAQEFLFAAAVAGLELDTAQAVHSRIAPILCASETDRVKLLEILERGFEVPKVAPRPAAPAVKKAPWTRRTIGIATAVVPLAIIAFFLWRQERNRAAEVRISKAGGAAPASTTVTVQRDPKREGPGETAAISGGKLVLTLKRKDPPALVSARDGDYSGSVEVKAGESVELVMQPPVELPPLVDPSTQEESEIELTPLRSLLEPGPPVKRYEADALKVALWPAAAGALVFLFWFLVERARRSLILQRMRTQSQTDFASLAAPDRPAGKEPGLHGAAAALRRSRPQEWPELDADATVERALSGMRPVELVYTPRRAAPEYLALIDKQSLQDHQARRFRDMLAGLVELGVQCDVYAFHSDPRVCASYDEPLRTASLSSILSVQHRATVLVFADSRVLVDPLRHQLFDWANQLADRRRAALLTPEPPARWSSAVSVLEAAGFAVLPATLNGLSIFAESDNAPAAAARYARPFPQSIEAAPGRWLGRARPRPSEISRLLSELEAYLGSAGFRWLAGIAIYPEIDWSLTADLAAPAGVVERSSEFAALARLPWLRAGFMPDWLRQELIASLSPQWESALRAAIEARLVRWASKSGSGGLKIGAWAEPADLARAAPEGSPLHDAVFLGFLSSGAVDRTAVAAPAALLRLFERIGLFRGAPSSASARWTNWARRAAISFRQRFVLRPHLTKLAASIAVALLVAVIFKQTSWLAAATSGPGQIQSMAISADESRVLVGRDDGSYALLDATKPGSAPLLSGRFPDSRVTAAVLSPSTSAFAVGSSDGSIRLYLANELQLEMKQAASDKSGGIVSLEMELFLIAGFEGGMVRVYTTVRSPATSLEFRYAAPVLSVSQMFQDDNNIDVVTRDGWSSLDNLKQSPTTEELLPKDKLFAAVDSYHKDFVVTWSKAALAVYELTRPAPRLVLQRDNFPVATAAPHPDGWAIAVNPNGESFSLRPGDPIAHRLSLPAVKRIALGKDILVATDGQWVRTWSIKQKLALTLQMLDGNKIPVGGLKVTLRGETRTTSAEGRVVFHVSNDPASPLKLEVPERRSTAEPSPLTETEIKQGKASRTISVPSLATAPTQVELSGSANGQSQASGALRTSSSPSPLVFRSVLTVGGKGNYPTIMEAINKARAGSTVQVNVGTYHEHVQLRPGITLQGNHAATTVIDGDGKGWVVRMADSSKLMGFTIQGSGSESGVNDAGVLVEDCKDCAVTQNRITKNGHYGIILRRCTAYILGNVIQDNGVLGIYADEQSNFSIQHNIIINHPHSGLDVESPSAQGDFLNNTVVKAGQFAVSYPGGPKSPFVIHMTNNIFAEMDVGISVPSGVTTDVKWNVFAVRKSPMYNFSANQPVTLDPTNKTVKDAGLVPGTYRLRPDSPAIHAGSDGVDAGASQFKANVGPTGPPSTK
jgi:hypothetical protein